MPKLLNPTLFKKALTDPTLLTDVSGALKINEKCYEKLKKMANNFTDYGGDIGKMQYFSGRDLNDMGRFGLCNDVSAAKYVMFTTLGLPIPIHLGICGPVECWVSDYNQLRPRLASIANKLVENITIEVFKIKFTKDNFQFNDPNQDNEKLRTLNWG